MSLKYNRTPHLFWSPGKGSDDKVAASVDSLLNRQIVLTEKIDGSNVCLEKDACFARTHSGPPTHESFDLFKALHASVKHKIPNDVQIFGEWVFALHSISYNKLPGYFLAFAVRDTANNTWQSWEDVELYASEINVPTVPVLWRGIIKTAKELEALTVNLAAAKSICGGEREGVVVRIADGFADKDFAASAQKMVRAGHVQTTTHWKEQKIVRNKLAT